MGRSLFLPLHTVSALETLLLAFLFFGGITSRLKFFSCNIIYRPKKLTLKGYKQYWCTFKDITISCYKSKEEAHGTPAHQMNLRGENTQIAVLFFFPFEASSVLVVGLKEGCDL